MRIQQVSHCAGYAAPTFLHGLFWKPYQLKTGRILDPGHDSLQARAKQRCIRFRREVCANSSAPITMNRCAPIPTSGCRGIGNITPYGQAAKVWLWQA